MSDYQQDINFRKYIFTYLSYAKSITFLAVLFIGLWIGYITFSAKIFEVRSLMQISENNNASGIEDILAPGERINLEEQIAIYTSRSNLGDLVDRLKLNIISSNDNQIKFEIDNYSFPYNENSQIFDVVSTKNGYDLISSDGEILLQGLEYQIKYNLSNFDLRVTKIQDFEKVSIQILNPEALIEKLQKSFTFDEVIQSRFVSFGKSLLNVSYADRDVDVAKQVLNTANEIFIEKDIETKRESANTTIQFLDDQIFSVGSELEETKEALNEFLDQNDSFKIDSETEFYAEQYKQISTQLQTVNLKIAEISSTFQLESSTAKKLGSQKDLLTDQLKNLNNEVEELPKIQQDYLYLLRQVDIKNILFENLSRLKLEYSVRQASTIANARVVDKAYFHDQIAPREINSLFTFFVLGLITSILYVVIFEIFFKRINNINDFLDLFPDKKLFGVLSFVDSPSKDLSNNENYAYDMEVISVAFNTYFKKLDESEKVMLITSATESTGKTTFTYEFSKMYTNQFNKKICIIDMDYKRGDLHENFGKEKLAPSSDLTSLSPDDFFVTDNLCFIPRIEKSSSKFMRVANSIQFENFIDSLKDKFDLVILDAPPVLGNSDALTLIQHCDFISFLVKHSVTKLNDFNIAMSTVSELTDVDINFIYNFHKRERSSYGYDYSYKYNYAYRYQEDKT